jgi:hypothetical protein
MAVIVILLSWSVAQADDKTWTVSVKAGQMTYNDDLFMAPLPSVKIEAEHRTGLYLFAQKDGVNHLGQVMDVGSVGVGGKVTILKHVRAYIQGGYFVPIFSRDGFARDLVYQAQRRSWGCAQVGSGCVALEPRYEVEIDRGFGGEVGVEFSYLVYKSWAVNLSVGWRYLRLTEHLYGIRSDGAGSWESRLGNIQDVNQDWGGKSIFGGISYEF